MNTATLFSSDKQDWTTPPALFRVLDAEFHFTLDAAATGENALCSRYYTAEVDALTMPWPGVVWLNFPYGRQAYQWVAKAWDAVYLAKTAMVVVVLCAARTDTRWWHNYAMEGAEIRFIRGRLHFGGTGGITPPAPFPSAILVFDRRKRHPVAVSSWNHEGAEQP